MPITTVDVPGRVFVKAVTAILITLLLIGFFRQIAAVVVMLALASIIAAVLEPVVGWLTRHRLSRGLASLAALLLLLLILGGLLAIVLPPIITQAVELVNNLPSQLPKLQRALVRYPAVYNAIAREIQSVRQDPGDFFAGALRAGFNVLSVIVTGFLVLTLALYLLIDKKRVIDGILQHTPAAYRDRVDRTITECGAVARAYFTGQVIVSALFSCFALIVLLVLGVPYALVVAAFSFVLDAIPNIGATLATVVTVLVALIAESATDALIIAVLFLSYQLVENNYISPRIIGGKLNISPVLTLTAIIIGGQVLGVVGVILAIPLAGMLPVIDRIWFRPADEPAAATESAGAGPDRPSPHRSSS